ncbi:hypothetical protein ACLOJK_026588 [Asimina triloba]
MSVSRMVGLACEWNHNRYRPPASGNGMPEKIATLQLATLDKCLIVKLPHMAQVPESLEAFLGDPSIFMVVVGNVAEKLREQYGLQVANCVSFEMLPISGGSIMAEDCYLRLQFEHLMLEAFRVLDPDWEVRVLTRQQIKSACFDAYIRYTLACKMMGS